MISGLYWLLLIWTWGTAWFGWSVEALTVATTGCVDELRSFWTFSKMTPELYKVADMTVTTLKYDPIAKSLKIFVLKFLFHWKELQAWICTYMPFDLNWGSTNSSSDNITFARANKILMVTFSIVKTVVMKASSITTSFFLMNRRQNLNSKISIIM